ncbi:hypothetical protein BE08_26570 [Sorangium cellulosum]|uniref:Orc1-like AAA ATPase domain-containing protein n=1 Tax=Sorangium cellulosum TaxID=56 RepID=A0A150NZE8_SORCE|nr:hypothetical protein BE08_26570 [Sorangium cellulosum]
MSARPFSAVHADAWSSELLDVPSLNKSVSDFLAQRVEDVRRAGARGAAAGSSSSVLLLGIAGSGKTHLFARLRRQIGPRAVFVHTRPELGADPSPRQVLAAVVRSLRRRVSVESRQQVEVMAGAMLASVGGAKSHFPNAYLDGCRAQSLEAQHALIQRSITDIEARFPEIWPRYLERLLDVLFAPAPKQRALFAWLSGEEPSQLELDLIGERGGLQDGDVLPALRTLGVVASFGAPIVLVFDQLENLVEEEGRTGRIVAYARLLSELRDTVRGLVLVQMALQNAWVTRIHPALHESDRARLEETVKHLALPRPEEKRQLIELWRAALPEEERARPFPHPFPAAEVEKWIRAQGMTPRMLMQACGEAYLRASMPADEEPASCEPVSSSTDEPLRVQWDERLAQARAQIDEEAQQEHGVSADTIRGGLIAALALLGVKAGDAVKKDIPSLKLRQGDLLRDVLIAQHAHHRSLASVIRAATGLAREHPAILLRERAFAIRPTWKEVERLLSTFLETPGARFVQIDREDLARLIALEDLLSAARSQDLCGHDGQPIPYADVVGWAEKELRCADWAPVAAALDSAEAGSLPPPEPGPKRKPGPKATGGARVVLGRLRVASIDRLVVEARALEPGATSSTVTAELRGMRIKMFGDAIVALEEPWL